MHSDLLKSEVLRTDDACNEDSAVLALRDLFKSLRYRHSQRTHSEILNSLRANGIAQILFEAACAANGIVGDFDIFAEGILRRARLAQVRGLVRPDGERRRPGGGRKPRSQEVRHG